MTLNRLNILLGMRLVAFAVSQFASDVRGTWWIVIGFMLNWI